VIFSISILNNFKRIFLTQGIVRIQKNSHQPGARQMSFQQSQLSTSPDIDIGARDSDRSLSTEIESDEEEEGIAPNYSVNDDCEDPTTSAAEISDNFLQEAGVEGEYTLFCNEGE
jgi:hypothetical protein